MIIISMCLQMQIIFACEIQPQPIMTFLYDSYRWETKELWIKPLIHTWKSELNVGKIIWGFFKKNLDISCVWKHFCDDQMDVFVALLWFLHLNIFKTWSLARTIQFNIKSPYLHFKRVRCAGCLTWEQRVAFILKDLGKEPHSWS